MNKREKFRIGIFTLLFGALGVIAVVLIAQRGGGPSRDLEKAPESELETLSPEIIKTSVQSERGSELAAEIAESPEEPTIPVAKQENAEPLDSLLPEDSSSPPRGPFEESAALRAQERLQIDPPMQTIGRAWMEDSERRNDFIMPVSGGRDLEIEVERFEAVGEDGGEFIGRVKGIPDSSVRLSYRGGNEAGMIRLPSENRSYRILPGENGQIIVQDRDLALDESGNPKPTDGTQVSPTPNVTPPSPP